MNRFCAIVLMILSTAFAEPPSSKYGLPSTQIISSGWESSLPPVSSGWESSAVPTSSGWESASVPSGWESVASTSPGWDAGISSGYNYQPTVGNLEYISHPVGRIPSEGLDLDPKLLNAIKEVLINHENSKSSSISGISTQYGPPSHWSKWSGSKVTGINFGHLTQSLPVAYYLGVKSYAPAHTEWIQKPTYLPPKTTYGSPKW